jgi:mitochondrial chaperone BCS1
MPYKLPDHPVWDDNDKIANQTISNLPTTILEAFIPGYSLISRFLWEFFGFDVSLIVSALAIGATLFTAGRFLYGHAREIFERYFTSSISIELADDMWDHIMYWLVEQRTTKASRSLVAKTGVETTWDPEDDDDFADDIEIDGLFNFSNWEARVPPRFEPYFGSHAFFHKGKYFRFRREKEQLLGSGGWGGQIFKDDEKLTLTVVGRSTQPIKDLILEARDRYLQKQKSHTIIRRPGPKEMRGRGRNMWTKVATRPSRPMETVVLDAEQKAVVLADINEYLHPASNTWYARRGIPYRYVLPYFPFTACHPPFTVFL